MNARKKSKHQIRFEQFMRKAGQEVPCEPTVPSSEVRLLRARLIFEEAMETIEALGVMVYPSVGDGGELRGWEMEAEIEPNLVEIADGCADVSVVALGTLSACGIADKSLLKEVDESNLRKFAPGCRKREDGKHLKPPDWKAPDISGVLNRQTPFTRGYVQFTDEEAAQLQSQKTDMVW